MVSKKLVTIIGLSTPFFVAHGLEEYYTGFYVADPLFKFVLLFFREMGFAQALFLELQIMLWLTLLVIFLLLMHKRILLLVLLCLFGAIFIVEIHHLIHALVIKEYYPGLATSILLLVLGYVYWRELIKEFYAQKN